MNYILITFCFIACLASLSNCQQDADQLQVIIKEILADLTHKDDKFWWGHREGIPIPGVARFSLRPGNLLKPLDANSISDVTVVRTKHTDSPLDRSSHGYPVYRATLSLKEGAFKIDNGHIFV